MKKWCSLLVLFILIFSIIDLGNTNGVSYAKDNEVSGRAVSNNFFISLVHSLKNIFSGTVGQDFTRDPIAAKDLRLTRENNNVILYWNEEINQITGRSIFSTSFDVVKKFFNNLFGKVGNIPEPGPELPPSAPYNLRAFALSDTQIRLTWEIDQLSENINIESGFKIERRQVGASDENFIQIIVVGPGVTSYQDTNLNPSTTYEYRVRAYNNYGNSPYSNTAQATTLSTQSTQLPPSAPYNLRAFALSDTQIRLTWEIDQLSENINIESGFKIERRQVGASDENFIQIIVVGPGVTSYQDTNLNPSTTYEYRVRAYNNYGNSPYSNTAQATTLSTQSTQLPPSAPYNLRAFALSDTQIRLTWEIDQLSENINIESGFKIERRQVGASDENFIQIIVVGPGVTSYQDTNLNPSTTYEYRVRAYNNYGNSPYSNTAQATTLSTQSTQLPPSAPYNLRAFALSDTQIRLTWEIDQLSENINIESGFKIERRQVGASDENFIQIIVVGPGVTSYQDTNLNPSTTYEYRVRAYNNYGNSPYSNTAQATTLSTQLQQYVLGYRIYRIKSDKGGNIVDKIITNTREDFQCDRLLTGCNYRDENLPPGDYRYFVKGVLIYQDRLEEGYTISNIVDVTIEQSQGSSGSDGGRTGRRSRTGSGTTGSGTVCSEHWLCGGWGSCINNIQRRSCIDLNNCNNVVPKVNKPSETRSCTTVRAPFGEDQFEQGEEQAGEIQGVLQNKMVRQIITIAVIILALLFLLFLGLRTNIFKKKEDNYYRIYKEVINSVKLAKKQGFSDNEIIKELKNKGWTYEQIKDIMKRV